MPVAPSVHQIGPKKGDIVKKKVMMNIPCFGGGAGANVCLQLPCHHLMTQNINCPLSSEQPKENFHWQPSPK